MVDNFHLNSLAVVSFAESPCPLFQKWVSRLLFLNQVPNKGKQKALSCVFSFVVILKQFEIHTTTGIS